MRSLIAVTLVLGALAPASQLLAGLEIPTDISQKDKPATIKVLVAKQKDKIVLEARGSYNVYNPLNGILITDSAKTTRHTLAAQSNGMKWDELLPGIFQIRVVPTSSDSTILVDGIEYRGCVEVYDIQGKLHVVNEVDVERYLKSILTAQFPTELDEEVMDAIAISARTNAYFLVSRKPHAAWHVEAQDVGYQGYALTLQNLHVDRAINTTRHMVLTYEGAPFPAAWTKDSAGKTSDYGTIFRKDIDAPHGVDAPFAGRDREKHAWSFTLTKQELAKALGASRVNGIDLFEDKHSQKVYGARVKDGSEMRDFDFSKLQKALGAVRLKSNDFKIESKGDQIVFKGFGEGSGVGLCLYSASAMADKGDRAPKILAAFFPETKLENIRTLETRH